MTRPGKRRTETVRARHCGLVVRDPDAMLAFYRDQLGFAVRSDRMESGPTIAALLDLPGVRVRTIKLAAGPALLLELLHFPGRRTRRTQRGLTAPGFTHLALTVTGLAGLCRRLRRAGAVLVSRPRISPDGSVAVCFCRDPEGNYLELVEERKRP